MVLHVLLVAHRRRLARLQSGVHEIHHTTSILIWGWEPHPFPLDGNLQPVLSSHTFSDLGRRWAVAPTFFCRTARDGLTLVGTPQHGAQAPVGTWQTIDTQ
jgi:hypothetical protein